MGGNEYYKLKPIKFVDDLKDPSNKPVIYEYTHSYMWLENGIVCCKYKPGLIMKINLARKMVKDRKQVAGGVTRPFLVDLSGLIAVDRESMIYLAGKEATEFMSAGAMYATGPVQELIVKSFLKMDKPPIPSKLFNDWQEAFNWLQTFKNTN